MFKTTLTRALATFRLVSIGAVVVASTFVCAAATASWTSDESDAPAWARRAAANGVWGLGAAARELAFVESNGNKLGETGEIGSGESGFGGGIGTEIDPRALDGFAAPSTLSPLSQTRRSFFPAFESDDAVLRAQSSDSLIPPVESPTTSTQIGASTVNSASSNLALPPVVGEEEAFAPTEAPTTEESTTFQKMFKYRQDVSGSIIYIPKQKEEGLGVCEIEARLLFAFPCKCLQEHSCLNNGYFLLTPSFTYTSWSQSDEPFAAVRLPSSTFDAGLTTMFAGQLGDFELKVEAQLGLASAFQHIKSDGIYIRGRAMGALPIDNEKQVKLTGGVIYYDRIEYGLVPSGGAIWTPNAQNVVELVYPDPRWSHYMTKLNETDWWFYLRGQIGGGRWLMYDGSKGFNFDYDDYRVGLGLTFDCSTRLKGCFEVGGAFNRKLVSKEYGTWYKPKDSVYLKFGLMY